MQHFYRTCNITLCQVHSEQSNSMLSYCSIRFLAQLGGNSLQAGAMLSHLRAALALDRSIPIVWLFQCQTVAALAARLAGDTSFEDTALLPPLTAGVSSRADAGSRPTPLSFQQVSVRSSIFFCQCLLCCRITLAHQRPG